MERQGMIGRRTFLAGLAATLAVGPARAQPHGWDPTSPFSQWVEGLKRPDDPIPPRGSCCGKGDLYSIVIDEDAIGDEGDAMGTARILDGSAREFPDGAIRPPIPDGTVFRFQKKRVNPPSDGNPGPSAWGFLKADNGVIHNVYCVVPLPGAV